MRCINGVEGVITAMGRGRSRGGEFWCRQCLRGSDRGRISMEPASDVREVQQLFYLAPLGLGSLSRLSSLQRACKRFKPAGGASTIYQFIRLYVIICYI